jgi:hypothetical protein
MIVETPGFSRGSLQFTLTRDALPATREPPASAGEFPFQPSPGAHNVAEDTPGFSRGVFVCGRPVHNTKLGAFIY